MIEIHAKADARVEYVFTQTKDDIEYQLIQTAHKAANAGNWVIGECASRWFHVYGNGRNDDTFAAYIELSEDKVWQCRRVWERFGTVYGSFKKLTWSHFREAVPWDDAEVCLEWAEDCEATVAEMRIWHRAQNGLDLFRDPKHSDPSKCETEEESRRRILPPEQNTPSPVKGTNEKVGRRALPPEEQNTTGTSSIGDKPAESGKAETVSGGGAKETTSQRSLLKCPEIELDLPDALHDWLKAESAKHNLAIEDLIIEILETRRLFDSQSGKSRGA